MSGAVLVTFANSDRFVFAAVSVRLTCELWNIFECAKLPVVNNPLPVLVTPDSEPPLWLTAPPLTLTRVALPDGPDCANEPFVSTVI